MSNSNKLETLIEDILNKRPAFYEGKILIKVSKSTLDMFSSLIDKHIHVYGDHDKAEKTVNEINFNGIEFAFSKDESLGYGKYQINFIDDK